jgi:hypothetical protein
VDKQLRGCGREQKEKTLHMQAPNAMNDGGKSGLRRNANADRDVVSVLPTVRDVGFGAGLNPAFDDRILVDGESDRVVRAVLRRRRFERDCVSDNGGDAPAYGLNLCRLPWRRRLRDAGGVNRRSRCGGQETASPKETQDSYASEHNDLR